MFPCVWGRFNKVSGDAIHRKSEKLAAQFSSEMRHCGGEKPVDSQHRCKSHHAEFCVLFIIHTGVWWPFWNVRVLGKKPIMGFPYSWKITTSSDDEKKIKIPFTKEKAGNFL
jgi:hypothetical protein